MRRLTENGGLSPADSLGTAASGTLDGMSDVDRKQRELYTRQQQLLREQRTADQEKLLSTISGLQAALPIDLCKLLLHADRYSSVAPVS